MISAERLQVARAQAIALTKARAATNVNPLPVPDSATFAERYRHFASPTPSFHRVWYSALDDPATDRILLLAPREHAKSSVVLTYVLRRICADRNVRVGLVSESEPVALAFMRDVKRELEINEDIHRFGGPFRPESGTGRWTDHEIIVQGARHVGKDVTLFALGSGGQVTGRHADVVVCDDIETIKTVATATLRAKTREWFAKELIPVLSPGGKIVVVGTRKHQDDLYAWLEKDAI